MLANCAHIMVSLLKAWKVTMVGIECNYAAFYLHFKKAWKVTVVGIECNGADLLNVISRRSNLEIDFFKILQVRRHTIL